MDIFKDNDLLLINSKKNKIENLDIKQLEKDILLMGIFESFYTKLFETFDSNIDKHIMYIKAKTNITFSRIKYLHYIKNNHPKLYDKYILLGVGSTEQNINMKEKSNSIKYYSDKELSNNLNDDKEEVESLLNCLEMKKKLIKLEKSFNLNKNLNFINGIVIFNLLILILFLI